jgi:glycine cleavage system H protein
MLARPTRTTDASAAPDPARAETPGQTRREGHCVYPEDLTYTAEHEWLRPSGEGDDAVVRVGITSYAQEALGDIVFVTLPTVGAELTAGQAVGEVESTKSVSDVYAPLAGTVTAVNDALESSPELVNSDPYGEGWMFELRPSDGLPGALSADGLLDAAAYAERVSS